MSSEIAAGLAYLACSGDDERLAACARSAPLAIRGAAYLERLQLRRSASLAEGRFNSRYERSLEAVELRPMAGDAANVCEELSRACLEVFHATHEFFALHLVTGSHAFRICSPWAGPNLGGLFSLGIGAAYLVVGAPALATIGQVEASLPLDRLAAAVDEHDIKLAYTCQAQARAYADAAYVWAASAYLAPRLPTVRRVPGAKPDEV